MKTWGETSIFKQDNDTICVLEIEDQDRKDWKRKIKKKKTGFCNNVDREEDGSQQERKNGNRNKTQRRNNF